MRAAANTNSRVGLERGRLYILAAAMLWSLAGVFIKFLPIHPLAIVFYRSLFAALVFTPFLKRKDFRCDGTILVSVLSYTAAISAFVSANKLTSAANAIVLQYTAPIFVFLFSWWVMREKIARANSIALAVAMVGIGIIAFDSAGEPEMLGVALALLSGMLFAGYMINLQRTQAISPVFLTWMNNLACGFLVFWFAQAHLPLTAEQTILLAVMGAVQLGAPYYLFSKGLRSVSLQEASLIALIEPVLNPLWVALIVGELPSKATVGGGAMILFGLGVRYVWPLIGAHAEAGDLD
jgi:drug/metabolite transporter, DME family